MFIGKDGHMGEIILPRIGSKRVFVIAFFM
jgi:hypothetical protein